MSMKITLAQAMNAVAVEYAGSADERPTITDYLLRGAAEIERLTARIEAAEAALRDHHEQALAALEDEYPDTPLYRDTLAALTLPTTETKE